MKLTGKLEFNDHGEYVLKEYNLSKRFDSLIDKEVDLTIKSMGEVLFDGIGKITKENYGGKLLKYQLDNRCFDNILFENVYIDGEFEYEIEVTINTLGKR